MVVERFRAFAVARWWFLAPCVVAGAIALSVSGLLVDLSAPRYEATAVVRAAVIPVAISSVSDTGLPSTTIDGLVGTEMILASSERVISRVAPHYPELTLDQIREEITTSSTSTPMLFSIHVRDTDPARAARLANDVAQTLGDLEEESKQQRDAPILQPLRDEIAATQARIDQVTAELTQTQAGGAGDRRAATLSSELTLLQDELTTQRIQLQMAEMQIRQNAVVLTIVSRAEVSATPVRSVVGGGMRDAGIALLVMLVAGILIAGYRAVGARLGFAASQQGEDTAEESLGSRRPATRELAPTHATQGRDTVG